MHADALEHQRAVQHDSLDARRFLEELQPDDADEDSSHECRWSDE